MASKCTKGKMWPFRHWKMTFRAIQPNLSFDMWFMSPQRSSMPKKNTSYRSVSEIDPSPLNRDGHTDTRTDRRTTDKSELEKLCCLSAGGAKNILSSKILKTLYSSLIYSHINYGLIVWESSYNINKVYKLLNKLSYRTIIQNIKYSHSNRSI